MIVKKNFDMPYSVQRETKISTPFYLLRAALKNQEFTLASNLVHIKAKLLRKTLHFTLIIIYCPKNPTLKLSSGYAKHGDMKASSKD
ncbi:hypothetical protein X798_01943 [Onchocerca flexuosa]|uniref:Uncharacterized protein n=1 Tax=Onchocerca flexuosa TaxID=387005 RepID=A0A238C0S0_9BILA|nr:hypothetical protein X798_01943 [Onchocerca flexuosa]